ncbi:aldo/keto reductase [Streptomyces sp. ID03-2B]|uniref:Aldo/keto reductase n=1 Tax=Streptomyces caviscabies TaxID=90079 RepID=A0ABW2MM88_9ACTN|nr:MULTISPECIES: aldo/keto reductase [unclassified Streptomyces]MCL6289173.1 aldo/keto reductase [Streptomyces sp. 43Y-GA-1]MDX3339007.1 aldo/keto reductase [Streptomyces sp. ME02-6979.5a]MDX3506374.1 aldo/keto reductase [Streptomyces sp. ATCC51928]MDX3589851.1 aldo/keto reductase [Streptomyces sp. ID03-2B]MDX5522221.1 aldo/keto reductase [Streptomyces sp. DE06-01C]
MADPRAVTLPCGVAVTALGQGTWGMGENPGRRAVEVSALRAGLDLGMTLVDTAEMYGDGAAEEVVAEAVAGRRDEVFLVSKVLPSHADARGVAEACRGSLRRLRTDRIDLYLLHWRGAVPLEETVEAFESLVREGAIRSWGVSNLDVDDLANLPPGAGPQTDQVLYNLSRRGPEYSLLPRCRELSIPVMAYSPVEQGRLLGHPALRDVAAAHGATPAQIALAWVLRHGDVIAIPKASSRAHVEENRTALEVDLTAEDLAMLDRAFPPPESKRPLEML